MAGGAAMDLIQQKVVDHCYKLGLDVPLSGDATRASSGGNLVRRSSSDSSATDCKDDPLFSHPVLASVTIRRGSIQVHVTAAACHVVMLLCLHVLLWRVVLSSWLWRGVWCCGPARILSGSAVLVL